MKLTKKSKIVIAVAVILAVIIVIGIVAGIVIWKREYSVKPGENDLINRHIITREETRYIMGYLPLDLLLPEKIDGDIEFIYGDLAKYQGISEDRLVQIRKNIEALKNMKFPQYEGITRNDFEYLRCCRMTVKGDGYDMEFSCIYENPNSIWDKPMPFNYVTNEKSEAVLNINRTYYNGYNRMYRIDIYPNSYKERLNGKDWDKLSKDEKIELYGREWFDSVELSDIDEFMKEVCAYNGINSDWLDNKPVYNIK